MTPIEQAAALCAQWGGRLSLVSCSLFKAITYSLDSNPWFEAPFAWGHALRWGTGLILVDRSKTSISAVIHEMGHVFADDKDPEHADEFMWFGWEYLLAKRFGVARRWILDNKSYGIGDSLEFGDLDGPKERRKFLEDRIQDGSSHGIITTDRKPIPRRRPDGSKSHRHPEWDTLRKPSPSCRERS